jgi:DDB1- and CUL4-associated factor 11
LSNDNKWLAISSLASTVTLAPSDPEDKSPERALNFGNLAIGSGSRRRAAGGYFYIFSVRWSGDGTELVAGAGDNCIYVYDLERGASTLRIEGHDDDVNAVCFGDENSPHILYSGSDDSTIKVWDRRSLSDGRPAGVFLGHTEGLTYIDSRGDGVYVLSNGKDQTAKLWDVRKMLPASRADEIDISAYTQNYDYRSDNYNASYWRPHPYDCSLVTFRGHAVERTLIRCHFSPPGSTDGRYVYSGSRDGKVYVWNYDATLKTTIDVGASAGILRGQGSEYSGARERSYRYECVVRDVSWHPYAPVIAGMY